MRARSASCSLSRWSARRRPTSPAGSKSPAPIGRGRSPARICRHAGQSGVLNPRGDFAALVAQRPGDHLERPQLLAVWDVQRPFGAGLAVPGWCHRLLFLSSQRSSRADSTAAAMASPLRPLQVAGHRAAVVLARVAPAAASHRPVRRRSVPARAGRPTWDGRIPDFPEQCVGKRWTVRLGEVEPVFGQTGRVVLDITARTAHDGALKWTRAPSTPRAARSIFATFPSTCALPSGGRWSLRRVLQRPGRQRKRSSAKSSCGPSRTSSSAPSSPPCCNARCAPPRLATRRAPSCATCPGGCGATAWRPSTFAPPGARRCRSRRRTTARNTPVGRSGGRDSTP